MNGIEGRMPRVNTLLSGRWCAMSCCEAPSTIPPASASGMLDRLANTAAAAAATMSNVNELESTTPNKGASRTPARPASRLDNSHENVETRVALMPLSSTMRWLSTTARIRSPIGVQRNRQVSRTTTATVATRVATPSALVDRLPRCKPCPIASVGGAVRVLPPKMTLIVSGIPTMRPIVVTSLASVDDVRSNRKMNLSSSEPERDRHHDDREQRSRDERPVVIVDQHVEDHRGRVGLRAEREVEHARRLERQDEADGNQPVDAPRGNAVEKLIEDVDQRTTCTSGGPGRRC